MDPLIDQILHNLRETVESLDAQILDGKMQSIEMYQAHVAMRRSYSSMIADIKEAIDNDHTRNRPSDQAGDEPG